MSESTVHGADVMSMAPVPADGVYFRGRPPWLTDEMLAALQAEAVAMRRSALKIHTQFFGELGSVARAFMRSPELSALVRGHVPDATSSDKANYRYYDYPGCHISPHYDDTDYELSTLLMLEHTCAGPKRSALVLFPTGPAPIRVFLEPGEMIIFHARGVIHGRSPVGADETVCNLGVGFAVARPIAASYWRPAEAAGATGQGA